MPPIRRTQGGCDGPRVLAITRMTIIGHDRVADGDRLDADTALATPVRRSGPPSGRRGSPPSPSPSCDHQWGCHPHPHRQDGCPGHRPGRPDPSSQPGPHPHARGDPSMRVVVPGIGMILPETSWEARWQRPCCQGQRLLMVAPHPGGGSGRAARSAHPCHRAHGWRRHSGPDDPLRQSSGQPPRGPATQSLLIPGPHSLCDRDGRVAASRCGGALCRITPAHGILRRSTPSPLRMTRGPKVTTLGDLGCVHSRPGAPPRDGNTLGHPDPRS